MIKHIVLVKFKPEATQEQKDVLLEAISQLPKQISEIKGFSSGMKGPFRCSHDFGIVVTFENAEGLAAYGPHPAHRNVVKIMQEGVVDMTSLSSLDYEE